MNLTNNTKDYLPPTATATTTSRKEYGRGKRSLNAASEVRPPMFIVLRRFFEILLVPCRMMCVCVCVCVRCDAIVMRL
jgi:hypothetical protein